MQLSCSIKTKLTMAIVLLILISLTALGATSYWNAKKLLIEEMETNLMALSKNNAEKLGMWFDTRKTEINSYAHSPIILDGDLDSGMDYLKKELKRNPIYLRYLIADLDGNVTYTNGEKRNLADRDYFQASKAGKTFIGTPVISKVDGKMVVVVSAPVVKNGVVTKVVGGTVDMETIIKLVNEIKVGKTGYAYAVKNNGLIILHPDKEMVLKSNLLKDAGTDASLKALTEKMVKGEEGISLYSFKGQSKYLAYSPVHGTDWSLAVNVPQGEVLAKLGRFLWTSAVIAFVVLVLSVVLSFFVSNTIVKPLGLMKSMFEDIAHGDGDLTKRLDDSSQDELGESARYFNQFVEKLHGLIGQISQTTVQLATASSQLHSTAEQMATGAEEVAAQAATVATAGEEMSATSGDIAQNCSMAAEGSRQASEAAVSGARVVDETIMVMNSISEKVRETAKTVESLGSRSEQIGDIVGTIQDIADQTNLLALNAAIEAARAGEQGRGFAVVADEVRALAERTTRATKEISEMIRAIQGETKGAVAAMEAGVDEVEKGGQKAADSGKALESILSQINEVTMQINQVATAAEEQTATTSEISNNMHQITDVVSNTSRGAQETSQAAIRLSELSEELRSVVSQFKL